MLVVFGGNSGTRLLNDTLVFSDRWYRVNSASSPSPRRLHACAAVNGFVLVFGGDTGPGGVSDELHCFDPQSDRWAQIPVGGPTARYGAAAAGDGTHFVLQGGASGPAPEDLMNDVHVLDTQEMAWAQIACEPYADATDTPPALYGHSLACVAPGRFVLVGGFAGVRNGSVYLLTVDYTAKTGIWHRVDTGVTAAGPAPRTEAAVASVRDAHVIMAGGSAAGGACADTWLLDCASLVTDTPFGPFFVPAAQWVHMGGPAPPAARPGARKGQSRAGSVGTRASRRTTAAASTSVSVSLAGSPVDAAVRAARSGPGSGLAPPRYSAGMDTVPTADGERLVMVGGACANKPVSEVLVLDFEEAVTAALRARRRASAAATGRVAAVAEAKLAASGRLMRSPALAQAVTRAVNVAPSGSPAATDEAGRRRSSTLAPALAATSVPSTPLPVVPPADESGTTTTTTTTSSSSSSSSSSGSGITSPLSPGGPAPPEEPRPASEELSELIQAGHTTQSAMAILLDARRTISRVDPLVIETLEQAVAGALEPATAAWRATADEQAARVDACHVALGGQVEEMRGVRARIDAVAAAQATQTAAHDARSREITDEFSRVETSLDARFRALEDAAAAAAEERAALAASLARVESRLDSAEGELGRTWQHVHSAQAAVRTEAAGRIRAVRDLAGAVASRYDPSAAAAATALAALLGRAAALDGQAGPAPAWAPTGPLWPGLPEPATVPAGLAAAATAPVAAEDTLIGRALSVESRVEALAARTESLRTAAESAAADSAANAASTSAAVHAAAQTAESAGRKLEAHTAAQAKALDQIAQRFNRLDALVGAALSGVRAEAAGRIRGFAKFAVAAEEARTRLADATKAELTADLERLQADTQARLETSEAATRTAIESATDAGERALEQVETALRQQIRELDGRASESAAAAGRLVAKLRADVSAEVADLSNSSAVELSEAIATLEHVVGERLAETQNLLAEAMDELSDTVIATQSQLSAATAAASSELAARNDELRTEVSGLVTRVSEAAGAADAAGARADAAVVAADEAAAKAASQATRSAELDAELEQHAAAAAGALDGAREWVEAELEKMRTHIDATAADLLQSCTQAEAAASTLREVVEASHEAAVAALDVAEIGATNANVFDQRIRALAENQSVLSGAVAELGGRVVVTNDEIKRVADVFDTAEAGVELIEKA